jgi:DNA-binding MarR family transcriptional regulator
MTKKTSADDTDQNAFRDFLPYQFIRITHHLDQALLKDLRKHQINISRWRVLAALTIKDGMTIGQMSEAAMMEQSALSRAVMKMEEEELVKRTLLKQDNRYVLIHLTKAGRALFDSLYPVVRCRQEKCIKGMSAPEVDQLLNLLARVRENLESD